jgi:integrase
LALLRCTDIDLGRNMISLTDESTSARHRQGKKARQTKSGRSRSFPIHADLHLVLKARTAPPDRLVFHGPKGRRLKPDAVRQVLIREVLTPLAGRFPTPADQIGFVDGRLHSFRHFFCSACANNGVPKQVVMKWLGRRDSAMARYYYHLHDDEAQRQMRRLKFSGDAGNSVVAGDH